MAIQNKALSLAATSVFALTIAAGASAKEVVDNTPPRLQLANDHGVADVTKMINITVHLTLRDQEAFDRTVDALYEPGSPTFHKWLTDADLKRFSPEPAKLQAVRTELGRNGLNILSIDKNGFSIRARGALGDVAKAFNTEIHEFERNGEVFRANIQNAKLSGVAGSYVSAVAGLENHVVHPTIARAVNLKTGKPYPSTPVRDVEAAGGLSSLITDTILSPSSEFAYSAANNQLPFASYTGLVYDTDSTLAAGYTSSQLQEAYGLRPAYKQGLDGKGETIVLLEGYGYPTVLADANQFSKLNGLPALDSSNFSIVYPEGKPAANLGALTGWDGEIALDVDWAHSIAPGAKIIVVATKGQDSEDFQASMNYIITQKLGNSVSDSWEEDLDLIAGPNEQTSFEKVLKVAAAKGVSFQFSTGDGGDDGLGTPVGAAGVPSVAPYATAVGGTAILNKVGAAGFESVGWGDTLSFIDGGGPVDPPGAFTIFAGGGGGGSSVYWAKPSWQKALPGKFRQTPDVSALADPYTGVPIVVDGNVEVGVGGTSLASPIFTAMWAIANQKAGHALGAAGPTIAGLKSGVTDVLPLTSKDDVSGSIVDKKNGKIVKTNYSAAALFTGFIPEKQPFISAVWDQPQYDQALAFGFALDSSLNVTKGWDNATGYGTPQDALAFIIAAAAAK